MQCFPPLLSHPSGAFLACDIGGGGIAIREAFHDLEKLRADERPIYEVIEPGEFKYTDSLEGDHCLQMISFTKPDVRQDIYYGGRKMLEDGRVKFPEWDTIAIEAAMDADERQREKYLESNLQDNELVLYDTLEDTFMEIKHTTDELCSIKVTRSPRGDEQFKAESKKNNEGKTVYMHKDRATALLLAIYLYKQYTQVVDPHDQITFGGRVVPRHRGILMFEPTNAAAIAMNKQGHLFENAHNILNR